MERNIEEKATSWVTPSTLDSCILGIVLRTLMKILFRKQYQFPEANSLLFKENQELWEART